MFLRRFLLTRHKFQDKLLRRWLTLHSGKGEVVHPPRKGKRLGNTEQSMETILDTISGSQK